MIVMMMMMTPTINKSSLVMNINTPILTISIILGVLIRRIMK